MPRAWLAAVTVLALWGALEGALVETDAGALAAVLAGVAAPAVLLALPGRPALAVAAFLAAQLLVYAVGAVADTTLMTIGACMAASVGLGRWLPAGRRPELVAGVLGLAAVATLAARYSGPDPELRAVPFFVGYLGATWAIGRTLRSRALEREDLEAVRARLERERGAEVAGAVAAERERIARELHAIIASSVRRVAEGAERAEAELDDAPEQAVATLREVRAAASGALVETRRLLGLLRAEEPAYAPQPSLRTLAERSSADGWDVHITGGDRALPSGLELAVYRIVEEALAVLGPEERRGVRVEVRRTAADVVFTVGVHAAAAPWVAGDPALAGMRERARLYGGELRPEGRGDEWTLEGRLPLEGVPA